MGTNKFLMLLLCCAFFASCGKDGDDGGGGSQPGMSMKILSSGATSVTLNVQCVNTSYVRILCVATNDASSKTIQDVLKDGTKYTGEKIVINGLLKLTTYTLFVVACNDNGQSGSLQYAKFTTEANDPTMYSWEQSRDGILSFSDMILCYGGSSHRTPYRWDEQRLAPFVSYTDQQGKEHWLFDSFLCLEFQLGYTYSYEVGHKGYLSAGKPQWQELIDYWFASNNGVNALEKAVKEAAQRMGTPPSKRKVILSMPEPVIYKEYANTASSTTYWGELNGRQLNFSIGKDRVDACKWYIDQVRKKFNEANYQYVELAGFYVISEEIVLSSAIEDGWSYELKKSDQVVPPVAEYLHALNECLSWIPYNRAGGYRKWKQAGVDYAYMQPNHFWDDEGKNPLPRFFSDIKANNLAMEFEFDEALLEGKPNCDVYKRRFREYMSNAESEGIYGKQPLSYYHGGNGFYELWASPAAKDKELYHEFCQFVIGNPLRK